MPVPMATRIGPYVLAATLLGILNASIVATAEWAEGQPTPFAWPLLMELTASYTFFLLLPLVVRFDRRFPVARDNWALRVPLHVAFSVLVGVTHTLMMWGSRTLLVPLLGWGSFDYGLMRYRFLMEYQKQFLVYVLVYAVVAFVDYQRRNRERDLRAAELRGQLVEARMDALKMQLNPHFLFNTLNAISSHVRADPERADTMISLLSDFLRGTLRHSERQEISLAEELELLSPYLEIMKARHEDRLHVRLEIAPETRLALVPHLLLQPLVENAVTHGVARRTTRGVVRIGSVRDGGRMRIVVQDDGPGLDGDAAAVLDRGLGLRNTRERLHALYGEGQRLELESPPDGGLRVTMELPWRQVEEGR